MSENENSPLNASLRECEATEANLAKLERLWSQIEACISEGTVFGSERLLAARPHLIAEFHLR